MRTIFQALAFFCLTGLFLGCTSGASDGGPPVIGAFTIFNRESPYLVAAPHGEYDDQTGEIVWRFCNKIRWDCLIAEGFRADHAPINVNRPTEGASLAGTRFTERASLVYARYVKRIAQISPGLRFYVEIHGNDYPGSEKFVEMATVGITAPQAMRIAHLAETLLAAEGLALEMRIDVLEKIRFRATHNRRFGVLSFIQPAMHLEFPLKARTAQQEQTLSFLLKFLPAVATGEFPPRKSGGKSP